MSKKILIIGATGSIGSKLRKTLLEKTDYELTLYSKGESFAGHDVSRQSIANLVLKLIEEDGFGVNESLGINRPE